MQSLDITLIIVWVKGLTDLQIVKGNISLKIPFLFYSALKINCFLLVYYLSGPNMENVSL